MNDKNTVLSSKLTSTEESLHRDVFLPLIKRVIIIVFSLITNQVLHAQTQNYILKDVGYISIPAEMEIQKGNYKKLAEAYVTKMGKQFGFEIADKRIVFQQNGLNSGGQASFTTYARVIIETFVGTAGDYDKLKTKINITALELKQTSDEIRAQTEREMLGTGLKIISWNGISITTVNGKPALKISFIRQLNDQPYVVVDIYIFQNNDRLHKLTLSYRQQDATVWQPLYADILKSFVITNIR